MRKLIAISFICLVLTPVQTYVSAQSDTGLPILAGQNATNQNRGNLSGKITIQGLDPSQPKPIVYVSVLYNGVVFDRRQVFENGSYLVPGIPRENVTVIVEVNGIESTRQSISPSILGNIQQDFTITLPKNTDH